MRLVEFSLCWKLQFKLQASSIPLYDAPLLLFNNVGSGLGNYWGQQVDLNNMLEHIDDEELEVVSHEMGHGFALPDFYQEPKPANFKPCLMDATTSSTVRDTDGWMLRRALEYILRNGNLPSYRSQLVITTVVVINEPDFVLSRTFFISSSDSFG
ncbi:hypothetical protein PC129_g13232 [Phytophthora cactorum]|uniref:Metallopeptidase, catalytic domain n=1 Tax=Phytophthora cactorum TaxID=29920 RepID=A0A329RGC5_9STRA|nr:hypothetical protein Pcac1_g4413 [Phytophthora cactorum]KAG2822082.1 hypothetical protein PC111_g10775 [Phytophthora cactorum]KAG2862720.1 hypothetical protein PC113_g6078 [Phytophthora cactorum]KAG2877898.1 hypothetical protein PC114_g23404 [Phytophthora cactorum]KAG2885924.1 hypothetical protein PC115_g20841 [Phytophthora cactorum]